MAANYPGCACCGLCGSEENENMLLPKDVNIPEISKTSHCRGRLLENWKIDCVDTLMEVFFDEKDRDDNHSTDTLLHYFKNSNYCFKCVQHLRNLDFTWRKFNVLYNQLKTFSRTINDCFNEHHDKIKDKDRQTQLTALNQDCSYQEGGSNLEIINILEIIHKAVSSTGEGRQKWTTTMDNRVIIKKSKMIVNDAYKVEMFSGDSNVIVELEPAFNDVKYEVLCSINAVEDKNAISTTPTLQNVAEEVTFIKAEGVEEDSDYSPEFEGNDDPDWNYENEKFNVEDSVFATPAENTELALEKVSGISCPVCGKKFYTSKQFAKHKRYSCGQKLKGLSFKRKVPAKRDIENKLHKCELCEKEFLSKGNLNIHMATHTKVKSFICQVENCAKSYHQSTNLIRHVRKYHGPDSKVVEHNSPDEEDKVRKGPTEIKSRTCRICQEPFLYSNLKMHMDTHKQGDSYVCPSENCNATFSRCSNLATHMKLHSKYQSEDGNKKIRQRRSKTQIHTCEICQKTFNKASNLTVHRATHTKVRSYVCPEEGCSASYAHASSLIAHKHRHAGNSNFPCTECDKRFFRYLELADHLRTHTGEKPFACEQCDKRCTTKGQLRVHMRIHTRVKGWTCDVCGLTFGYSGSLKRHIAVHSDEKPFKCSRCGKDFRYRENLSKHELSHAQIKSHVCEVCGKGFILNTYLKIHQRTHTGEKPYECTTCGKFFRRHHHLKGHKQSHEKEKPMMQIGT